MKVFHIGLCLLLLSQSSPAGASTPGSSTATKTSTAVSTTSIAGAVTVTFTATAPAPIKPEQGSDWGAPVWVSVLVFLTLLGGVARGFWKRKKVGKIEEKTEEKVEAIQAPAVLTPPVVPPLISDDVVPPVSNPK